MTAAQNERDERLEQSRAIIAAQGLQVTYKRIPTDTPSPSPEANPQDGSQSEDERSEEAPYQTSSSILQLPLANKKAKKGEDEQIPK